MNGVDWMLNTRGTYLRISVRSALKQILAVRRSQLGGERTAVIRQLLKIAPQDARIELVNEVCGDNPTVNEIFREVPFPTLPETDTCLRQKIHTSLDTKKLQSLQWATESIARFASAAIYDDLFTLYQQSGMAWDKQAQGSMLAYLVRWNPQRGLPLLEAALPRAASTPDPGMTFALGRAGYIPPWIPSGATPDQEPPEMAAQAAYQLSEIGPSEDQAVFEPASTTGGAIEAATSRYRKHSLKQS